MPKVYGVKEKDVAVAHIVDQILTGELRTGDRVDRTEVAARLGMSRVPVQEAILQLERDGILVVRYHRGAFVEPFDAAVVREHYEVYGALSGIACARAATGRSAETVAELSELVDGMADASTPQDFEERVVRFRRVVNHGFAGPRLRAALTAFSSFMPRAFWMNYADLAALMLPHYCVELAAILSGDAEAARQVCADRAAAQALVVVRELERRGVFPDHAPSRG